MIPNQTILSYWLSNPGKSNAITVGSSTGITIKTIGTHSKGQPRRNINTIINIKIIYGDISSWSKASVIILGVPSEENSAPKKLEAATKNMINTVISKALIMLSKNPEISNLP